MSQRTPPTGNGAGNGGAAPKAGTPVSIGKREEFALFCGSHLHLDPETLDDAWGLMEECQPLMTVPSQSITGGSKVDDILPRWRAACIFLAVGVSRMRKGAGVQASTKDEVSSLLKASSLSLVELCKELNHVLLKAGSILSDRYGGDLAKDLHIKEMQHGIVHLSVIHKKYQQFFYQYLKGHSGDSPSRTGAGRSALYNAGWAMFLVCKDKLLAPYPDLVSCFNVLVCTMNLLLIHAPASSRLAALDNPIAFPARTANGAQVDLLASLAEAHKAHADDLRELMPRVAEVVRGALGAEWDEGAGKHPEANRLETGCCPYGGAGVAGPKAAKALSTAYDAATSDVDERLFAEDGESGGQGMAKIGNPQTPSLALSKQPTGPRSSGVFRQMATGGLATPLKAATSGAPMSPLGTPLGSRSPAVVPKTPMSEALASSTWVRDVVAASPDKPTGELLRLFKACDRDVTDAVESLVNGLVERVMPAPPTEGHELVAGVSVSGGAGVMHQRQRECVRLYYRVLTALLLAEEKRTGSSNFTRMLTSSHFHTTLLACACELIAASYKIITLAFPEVLTRLDLKPYSLIKVVEPFVRHEPTLPRALKRHLSAIEESVIESLAWEKGSSLYAALRAVRPPPTPPGNGEAAGPSASPASTPTPSPPGSVASGDLEGSGSGGSGGGGSGGGGGRGAGGGAGEKRPHASAFSAFASPAKPRASGGEADSAPLPAAFGTPARRAALRSGGPSQQADEAGAGGGSTSGRSSSGGVGDGGGTEASTEAALGEFLKKALRLAALRLADLCERLHLSSSVLQQAYAVVENAVYEHTRLLYGRHLDQLVLSALYGVCKVNQVPTPFRDIISQYRKQPQCRQDVFRSVVLELATPGLDVQRRGDIIEFYNKVFIPSMKAYLLAMGQAAAAQQAQQAASSASPAPPPAPGGIADPGSPVRTAAQGIPSSSSAPPPVMSPFPTLEVRSPRKMGGTNVYVSPLRPSKAASHDHGGGGGVMMTPQTRRLYAFVGESTVAFQSPAKDLKMINGRVNGLPSSGGAAGSGGAGAANGSEVDGADVTAAGALAGLVGVSVAERAERVSKRARVEG